MIEVEGLTKTFPTRSGRERIELRAVDGVDLRVDAGEIVGFLGPNGAGKTTTLRMLTTLIRPTGGRAVVAGHDVAKDPVGVRRSIGYVSQSGSTGPEARAGEEVVDHGMLYGVSRAAATARARELFAELELDGLWERKPRTMSGGQRRRLDIAMGLVHDPRLVFLDEPTTGLDPQARANLWEHIAALRAERGATVFLTTHYLDEADALCDRILVIDHGRIVASDTPDALKRQVAGDLVELTVADPSQVGAAVTALAAARPDEPPEVDGVRVAARVREVGDRLPGLVRALDDAGVVLAAIEVRRPTLDDVFLTVTGRSLREDA
ncbi:ATP-binding cassette domain-containing protein [Amnibacterium sp.]|uniref:ATP-binding cassette domain-containing protein n=1 Tax=Amnibacterium sp. TaxID=1872496 RepID=UPI003F7BDCE5